MASAGRPKLVLDENLIYSLANKGCSDSEIASIMAKIEKKKVSVDVLVKKRGVLMEQARAEMRRGLREVQLLTAMGDGKTKPNPLMQIWLGKQLLGQADKVEATNKFVVRKKSKDIWQSAFGTPPKRPVSVPTDMAPESEPPETVQ